MGKRFAIVPVGNYGPYSSGKLFQLSFTVTEKSGLELQRSMSLYVMAPDAEKAHQILDAFMEAFDKRLYNTYGYVSEIDYMPFYFEDFTTSDKIQEFDFTPSFDMTPRFTE